MCYNMIQYINYMSDFLQSTNQYYLKLALDRMLQPVRIIVVVVHHIEKVILSLAARLVQYLQMLLVKPK